MIRLPTELHEVVKQDGTVVVPSRQRAHAARLAHAAAELANGRSVWATPDILPVEAWLTREIERYAATAGTDVPRLLSPAEEWFLWRQCTAEATGELELVNRGALAEALRRASATAADYGINIRGGGGPPPKDVGSTQSIASESGLASETTPGSAARSLSDSLRSDSILSDSLLEDGPPTEAALLAEVQRAVDERCQSLGAATVASLTERLRSGISSRLPHGGEGRVVGSGFLSIPPRLKSIVSPSREVDGTALVIPNAIMASDELDELERIAQWCKQRVERNPDARILIMLPGAPGTRERLATLIRQAVRPSAWFRTEKSAVDARAPSNGGEALQPDTPSRPSAASELSGARGSRAAPGSSTTPDSRTAPGASAALESHAASGASAALQSDAASGSSTGPGPRVAPKSSASPEPPATTPASSTTFGGPTDSLVVIEGGVPLSRVPAVAHALATLSWLGGNAGDFEAVSGWLRSPYWQTPGPLPRARLDLWLRERERMHFDLHEIVGALSGAPSAFASTARDISAQINRAAVALGQGSASPRDWSERFRAALEVFEWPGERARGSGEQQTVVRFYELLDEFGQLASAARSISRDSAIQWFTELATRTAFRPADDDAVITISSTLADPVVRYDAIWVAGLHAEAFPQPVQPDPFIPLGAQLAAGVPAASAGGRLAEARALISSWRAGADELVLSAPARSEDLELLASPLLAEWLTDAADSTRQGADPRHTPASRAIPAAGSIWLPVRVHRDGMLETFEDSVGPTWPIEKPLPSGTRSLELQNQCPFRAYAELRLGSTPLDAPEPGIAADLRGQLLHAALQKLWGQLRDSQGLASLSESALDAAIQRSVEEAADETVRRSSSNKRQVTALNDMQGDLFGDPERSPALSRECRRATRLIRALCAVERERAPFRVESTETDSTLTLMGAQLRIRIDRVDALKSGGRAILDYKSGRRTTADWYGERPSHPQLLAYLAALGEDVVAMATVNVTAREVRFDGIANSAELLPKVRGVEGTYGTDPLDAWPIRRQEWLSRVEHLAADFLAGRAVVDPKPGACDYCHVASICRVSDRVAAVGSDSPVLESTHE